jgi:hypothetical protein
MVAVVAIAGAVGFVGARVSLVEIVQTQATPIVDAATLDQQRFATDLRPIHAEMEQSVLTVGVVVAAYEDGEIDAKELQRRLALVLMSYDDAAAALDALAPPADAESTVMAYREELTLLRTSGQELSKAFDDGDQARVGAALGATVEAAARLYDLVPQQDMKELARG